MRNLFPIIMLITNMAFNNDDNNDNNNLIQTTCKATPNYPLCLTTLQSDPRTSDEADVTTLGLVMVDAVRLKAIETMENIKELEKSKPEWRRPLSNCYMAYYAIIRADVPEAIEALKRGVPKFAEHGMMDAAIEAETCEYSFKLNGLVSPVSEMNKDIIDLSTVAKSIIRMLL